jgi:hypothetical protein
MAPDGDAEVPEALESDSETLAAKDPPARSTSAGVTTGSFSDEPIGRFRVWRAMDTVRKLSGGRGIGVRERATEGERRGALFVARKFENLGYKVRIQKFSIDGGTSRNVVARWPRSVDHPLVIGGHIDTVPGSPGANDNASGVAAILEAARLAAGKKPVKYIRWVAFGAEEYGDSGTHHDGSEVYVQRMGKEGRSRSPGAISVDMVADGKPLLTGSFGIGPPVLGRMVFKRIQRKGEIALDYRTLCDCSDNGPFEHAGIPGAYMHSGSEDPDYHSSTDTPPNLVPKHLKRTGKALLIFIRRVDQATIRELRKH